jgi:LPXTG-site transpeptidase (sortase) family protein
MFAKLSNRPLALLELGSWLAGIGALAFYVAQAGSQHKAAADGLSYFASARPVFASERVANRLEVGAVSTALWSPQRIKEYELSVGTAGLPIGVLRIPSVALNVPIYEGTGDEILKRGAGHIGGTAPLNVQGNSGVAAHRDSFFRPLKDVSIGDVIVIETLQGVEHYRISRTWIVSPDDVSVLTQTTSQAITLVTCYPFYHVGSAPQRFIVRAERIA